MNTFTFTHRNETFKGRLILDNYHSTMNDAIMLQSWNEEDQYWESYANISINTDYRMMPGEFIANHDITDLVKQLAADRLFVATGLTYSYGYVVDQPVFRITDKGREFVVDKEFGEPEVPDESMDGDHQSALESVYGPEDDYFDSGGDWDF